MARKKSNTDTADLVAKGMTEDNAREYIRENQDWANLQVRPATLDVLRRLKERTGQPMNAIATEAIRAYAAWVEK